MDRESPQIPENRGNVSDIRSSILMCGETFQSVPTPLADLMSESLDLDKRQRDAGHRQRHTPMVSHGVHCVDPAYHALILSTCLKAARS